MDDLDIIEHDDKDYYYSTKTNYVYEFANDLGDVGNCVGRYINEQIKFN